MDFSLIFSVLTTTVPIIAAIFAFGYKVSYAERKIYEKIDTHDDELDKKFAKLENQFVVLLKGETHLQEVIQLRIDKETQRLESSIQTLQRELSYTNGELEEVKSFLSKSSSYNIRNQATNPGIGSK